MLSQFGIHPYHLNDDTRSKSSDTMLRINSMKLCETEFSPCIFSHLMLIGNLMVTLGLRPHSWLIAKKVPDHNLLKKIRILITIVIVRVTSAKHK